MDLDLMAAIVRVLDADDDWLWRGACIHSDGKLGATATLLRQLNLYISRAAAKKAFFAEDTCCCTQIPPPLGVGAFRFTRSWPASNGSTHLPGVVP